MSRKLLALGVFVVGVSFWLAIGTGPSEEPSAAVEANEPVARAAAPNAAPPAAATEPAPTPSATPEEPEPEQPAEPAAPQEPETNPRKLDELIKGDQGPVAEYRALFDSEPRESNAPAIESEIRAAFPDSDGAPDMVRSILCHKTMCKLEIRWSMERMRPYIAGLTRAKASFQYPLAVSPVGPVDKDGTRPVEVYLKRRPTGAAAVDHH